MLTCKAFTDLIMTIFGRPMNTKNSPCYTPSNLLYVALSQACSGKILQTIKNLFPQHRFF